MSKNFTSPACAADDASALRRRRRHHGLVALAAVPTLALAACSSGEPAAGAATGSAAGSAKVEDAKAILAKVAGIPDFTPPGPVVNVTALMGKKIFNIPISSEIPFDQAIGDSMKRIADEAGIGYTTFANRGQPNEWVRGIDLAISQKPDLLMLQGAPDPKALQPQLKKAQAAGIPVLVTHQYPNGVATPEGVTAQVTGPFVEAAEAEVAYAVAQSGDATNILVVTAEEVPVTPFIMKALKETKSKLCEPCKIKTVNVPISSWATKIQSEVQSALIADPKVNWVIPTYDGMTQFAAAGIVATGRRDVRIATFNGTPAVLKMIQDADVVAMDAGENPDWLGHANMDQAFRLMAGMEAVEQNTPVRVFSDENISDAGTPPALGEGYGDDYAKGYRKLWGLG